jgi:ubiquinone/menaquinone biosynthesis C-methylase UbiE
MTEAARLTETSMRIFSGLAETYDLVLKYATLLQDNRWKDWVAKSAGLVRGMRVLDIGCGTCVLEERMRKDVALVGLDLSIEMLRLGHAKHLPSIECLLLSDGQSLPFGDSSFDAVLSCYAVKYCDVQRFVSEASRVLRPGGRLILYDFVRPRGAFWPANAIYAYGGLRLIGKLLEIKGSKNAYTFSALPKVIEKRPWEVGFATALGQNGFIAVEGKFLTGGAAMGFRGEKRPVENTKEPIIPGL